MNAGINFVGIDVDDKSFHGYAISKNNQSGQAFCCRPTTGALIKKLNEFKESGTELKVCYEATYVGFTLHRALKTAGIDCSVIAPSLISRVPGKQVKTDRIDAKKLAKYFMNGQLTCVHVPNEAEERIRSPVRTRKFFCDQLKALMGNKHIRTGVIEACQTVWNLPRLSKRLKASRAGINSRYSAIADRCMDRLYKKSHRLIHKGKEKNKVKVACAREMLCFIWESLYAVAA